MELLYLLDKLSLKEMTFSRYLGSFNFRTEVSNTVISEGLCYEDYYLSCIWHHVRDHGNGSFHMSSHIGTLERVRSGNGFTLVWKQVEWIQQSTKLIALDQQLQREQVS